MQLGKASSSVLGTITAGPFMEAAPIRVASRTQIRAMLATLGGERGYTVEQFVGRSGTERIRIVELDPR